MENEALCASYCTSASFSMQWNTVSRYCLEALWSYLLGLRKNLTNTSIYSACGHAPKAGKGAGGRFEARDPQMYSISAA
jgi:hypothetical protein